MKKSEKLKLELQQTMKSEQRKSAENWRLISARVKAETVDIYGTCKNAICPAKNVHVEVEDFDRELLVRMVEGAPNCPICGVLLNVGAGQRYPIEDPETKKWLDEKGATT